MDRTLLSVKRFDQESDECAIAAIASIANFYDPKITYKDIRDLLPYRERRGGLYTSQQGRLLNLLGFSKVNIITADLNMIDFSWSDMSRRKIINRLKRLLSYHRRIQEDYAECVEDMLNWLSDKKYDNTLIIDNDFHKHVRRVLSGGRPMGVSLNMTSMLRQMKAAKEEGDIKGDSEYHAVVLRGYDEKGVFVVDSNPKSDHYDDEFNRGYYKLTWEKFLINLPGGDLIWAG